MKRSDWLLNAFWAAVLLVLAWLLLGCTSQCWTLDETGEMVACGEVEDE